jgi:uncharacterized phage protein gp47/JayE
MIEIESIRTIADQVLTDIESKTNQNTPNTPVSYNRILSLAVSAVALLNKMHNVDQRKECFPQTATPEIGLKLWGELKDRPRKPGIKAELGIGATGVNDTIVSQGSSGPTWIATSGIAYTTKTGGRVQSGAVPLTITATVYGTEGTLSIGDEVILSSSVPGLDTKATVTSINIIGENEEEIEDWRAALVQKIAFPPDIGTSAWFYNLAVSIDGITRAYPYVDEDYPGKIIIYAVDDSKTDGAPSASQLSDIVALFSEAGNDCLWSSYLLPSGDPRITAVASPIDTYAVKIFDGAPSLSSTMKEAIESALDTYADTRNPYIKGLSMEDQGTVETVSVSAIIQNVIDSNPSDTGRFTGVSITLGSTTAEYFTLEMGRRVKFIYAYE